MEKQERLQKAFQFLKDKGMVRTKMEVAQKIGMDNGNLSRCFKGDSKYITTGFLHRFNAAFNGIFSDSWLLTGEGEMFNEVPTEALKRLSKGSPYYNIDFNEIPTDLTELFSEFSIDFKPFNTATLWCNVKGDSMTPDINNGDVVALREIVNKSFISYGEIYGITMANGISILRRIVKSENEDRVVLKPANSNELYSAQEISMDMIEKLYLVLGIIRKY